jgi:hypothetical protein
MPARYGTWRPGAAFGLRIASVRLVIPREKAAPCGHCGLTVIYAYRTDDDASGRRQKLVPPHILPSIRISESEA